MEEKQTENSREQNIINNLAKLKIEFYNNKEECKKLREINIKLEAELKEFQELEKSHRYHLLTSREMIGKLQDTVSQLVYLKRDNKKIADDINKCNSTISALEKEKNIIMQKHDEAITELRNAHQKHLEELNTEHIKKIQQVQQDRDNEVAQVTCVVEELQSKISDMEIEHRDKINVVVLDYEEKIQRGEAQVAQLQEQLSRQPNIDVYKKRLEELEEKLKQNNFKQYLARSSNYSFQHGNQVERPYSAERDPYHNARPELGPGLELTKPKTTPNFHSLENKTQKTNTLPVMYCKGKAPNVTKNADKKGPFIITKKRKLFNAKDFQDM